MEVFVDAPLSVVEARDPKGLYKKARAGVIPGMLTVVSSSADSSILTTTEFTGISAPYETPDKPEIHIRTDELDVTQSVEIIVKYMTEKGYL